MKLPDVPDDRPSSPTDPPVRTREGGAEPAPIDRMQQLHEVHQRARERFAPAAQAYVASATHASGAELSTMVELARAALGGLEGRAALDVATGGGHVARVLAGAGARVTATDLTPQMLAAAEGHLRKRVPHAVVRFVAAPAEAMPFEDGAFDVVTCRIAAHHFHDPLAFLAEAHRVLAPGGLLLVVDNVAPEDAGLAGLMNELERLRDPSHVEAYSVSRWVAWAAARGFEVTYLERFWRVKELTSWLDRAGTPATARARLLELLEGSAPEARAYLVPGAAGAGLGDQDSVPDTDERVGAAQRLRHEVMVLAAERR